MAPINCEDCLKTYRPYRYVIALLRVLMYGFSDWWEFEDEWVIRNQFRKHSRNPIVKQWLINKTTTYIWDDTFSEDFIFYSKYLENKRRKTVSATFLCFDCEKYYCTNCVSKHSGHFTFSKDDKYDKSKWSRISKKMLEKLYAEGDQKRENMKREKTLLLDVLDLRCAHDEVDLLEVLSKLGWKLENRHSYEFMEEELHYVHPINRRIEDVQILNDNKIYMYIYKNYIKIFDVDNNKMTRRIKLASSPYGITDVPSTDSSQSLFAVSFAPEKQITIMNIHSTPAQVVSSINVQSTCHGLAYCNNKLITMCREYLDRYREWCYSIHVMDMAGKIINKINLRDRPDIKLNMRYLKGMSVHSESETIYVCYHYDPSCVISLSLDGKMLNSVKVTDLKPALIHVDKDQNVYVMSNRLPIYKLSADFRHREKIIDKDVGSNPYIQVMGFHYDKFYLASYEGHVYIIQYDSSRGDDQREHDEENRPVQYVEHDDKTRPVQYVIHYDKTRPVQYVKHDDKNRPVQCVEHDDKNRPVQYVKHDGKNRPVQYVEHDDKNRPVQYVKHDDKNRPVQCVEHDDKTRPVQYVEHDDKNRPVQCVEHDDKNRPVQYVEHGDETRPVQSGKHGDETRPVQSGKHGDKNRPVPFARGADKPNPSIQSLKRRQIVASKTCFLL